MVALFRHRPLLVTGGIDHPLPVQTTDRHHKHLVRENQAPDCLPEAPNQNHITPTFHINFSLADQMAASIDFKRRDSRVQHVQAVSITPRGQIYPGGLHEEAKLNETFSTSEWHNYCIN